MIFGSRLGEIATLHVALLLLVILPISLYFIFVHKSWRLEVVPDLREAARDFACQESLERIRGSVNEYILASLDNKLTASLFAKVYVPTVISSYSID